MTAASDRWFRRGAIAVVIVVAAGVAVGLRARWSRGGDADRVVTTGEQTVASERFAQRPPPPPQLPDVARPGEEERKLPDGWESTVRSVAPESVTIRMPSPGEVAPVRAYRFVPGQQPPASQPPNPFVPAKQDLSEEDLHAGLAE
jgi:hypothetical protein